MQIMPNANAYQANLSSIINDLRNNVINNSELCCDFRGGRAIDIVNQPAVLNAHQGYSRK
jgi:hypothetical protein